MEHGLNLSCVSRRSVQDVSLPKTQNDPTVAFQLAVDSTVSANVGSEFFNPVRRVCPTLKSR